MKISNITTLLYQIFLVGIVAILIVACSEHKPKEREAKHKYDIPEGYLAEEKQIPSFWITTNDEVNSYLKSKVKKGELKTVGKSAGGRPIMSVSYGKKREGVGTTTFSGSIAVSSTASYRGADSERTVYMAIGGVHGFELEGIMGIINMIQVFETGKDLNGNECPELAAMLDSVDRIVLIPIVNPDGRARVPIRMETSKGGAPDAFTVHEYLNTGGKKDGSLIGWPQCKAYIPMNFADFSFPGGYPNDAGVNIMHDDFLGSIQPETKVLFDIAAEEKPDLIMNMHTGVSVNNYFMQVHRPLSEPELQPVFDALYKKIKVGLTINHLQGSMDTTLESTLPRKMMAYNLSTALNLHCGALSVVIESPSHGYQGKNLAGMPTSHTPESLLKTQLQAHLESLRFLAESKGRGGWEKSF